MAWEIEILAKLECDLEEAKQKLHKFEYVGSEKTIDIYFFDPKRENLQPSQDGKILECFRLRKKGNDFKLAFKVDHYDGETWKYSDETEISVSDFEGCNKIILLLGLKQLVIVDNTKHIYLTDGYEIVLEEVKNLGNFIEVEAVIGESTLLPDDVKVNVRNFMSSLGIQMGEELNSGKPELLIKKQLESK